jgi:hypothetical protein
MLTSSNLQPSRAAILFIGDKLRGDSTNHPLADRSVLRIITTIMPSRLDLRQLASNIKFPIRISVSFKVGMAIMAIRLMRMIPTRRIT